MVQNSPLVQYDPFGEDNQWHHLLPRQFADKFFQAGLDINAAEFGHILDETKHIGAEGIHSGWNETWRLFFERYPRATKKQILSKFEEMKSWPFF